MTGSTQTKYPWRATVRTTVAGVVALVSLLPTIALVAHVDDVVWVGQVLAVAAAVTRVLAIPSVDYWLKRYLPWLASAPLNPVA